MTLEQFRSTIATGEMPDGPPLLRALWCDARGDWDEAHRIAQDVNTPNGAWVHAYLHRKEGDIGNAHYWYRRAGRPAASDPLDVEWAHLVEAML
jgi:hypothetical protein